MDLNKTLSRFLSRFALLLCILLFFSSLPLAVFAEEGEIAPVVQNGVMIAGNVRVRSGPGTNFKAVTHNGDEIRLWEGHKLKLHGEAVPDSQGGLDPWFFVTFTYENTIYEGYVRNDFIFVQEPSDDIPVIDNPAFEEQLAAFPEGYHAALLALHEAHPSWNFEAVMLPLDWGTVLKNQNVFRRSMTNSRFPSFYSTVPGSYNWETDSYTPLEAGVWYQASPALVAYYLDARNFLNEAGIFQFEQLTFGAEQTEESIQMMLQGTFMEGKTIKDLEGNDVTYAKAFLDAAYSADVSAFHLVTRCIQEVGRQGSSCAHGNYPGFEGYYNFFSIGAYSGALDGMAYAEEKGWDTPYKAILAGGSFIGNDYIAKGQDTPYFQKFSVVDPDYYYWHQYMTNIAAAQSEATIQRTRYDNMGYLDTAFSFRIPIYANMPDEIAPMPPQTGSPNNYLQGLSVEGYSLNPSFDLRQTLETGIASYRFNVPEGVDSVKIAASAVSPNATVSGNLGEQSLFYGENTFLIYCTAPNGQIREYTVRVFRIREGLTCTNHRYDNEADDTCNDCGAFRESYHGWCLENGRWVFYQNGIKLKNEWMADSVGWCYLGEDGYMVTEAWVKDSVGLCYVGADGYCVKNTFMEYEGKWCYLGGSGSMLKDTWAEDEGGRRFLGSDGFALAEQWGLDEKGWFYFGSDGYVATNTWLRDSSGPCYAGEDGYCVKNTFKEYEGKWIYLNALGSMARNTWAEDKGGRRFLGSDGFALAEQWVLDEKGWFYFGSDGYVATNTWLRDSSGPCYAGEDGYCVKNTFKEYEGKWIYLNDLGSMARNTWAEDEGGRRYLMADGFAQTDQWVLDEKGWFYFGSDGYVVTDGWAKDSAGLCYLGKDGYLRANLWVLDSVGWKYAGAGGYLVTNAWRQDSVGWCYLGEDGYMVTEAWVKDSVGLCYVGAGGYCVTNAFKEYEDGKWCYLDQNGSQTKSAWVQLGTDWFYVNESGFRLQNTTETVGGTVYTFDENGKATAAV